MKRRAVLSWGAAAAACVLAGHGPAALAADDRLLLADLEPDGLWPIYRRYRLLIVGQRDDERGSALAEAVVDVLARFLPDSRASTSTTASARALPLSSSRWPTIRSR